MHFSSFLNPSIHLIGQVAAERGLGGTESYKGVTQGTKRLRQVRSNSKSMHNPFGIRGVVPVDNKTFAKHVFEKEKMCVDGWRR